MSEIDDVLVVAGATASRRCREEDFAQARAGHLELVRERMKLREQHLAVGSLDHLRADELLALALREPLLERGQPLGGRGALREEAADGI